MEGITMANVAIDTSVEESVQTHTAPRSLSSLTGLLVSYFLGAFNDNVYKMVVSLLAVDMAAQTGGGGSTLSMIGAIFVLPFLLFSGYAGYVADVFSKRSVLVVTKGAEIAIMGLGSLALLSGSLPFMLAVLFLLALQATFFSPAKYSILPELVDNKDLSRANGLLEMTGFLAIILGTSLGGIMFAAWKDQLGFLGMILTALAVVGTAASFAVPWVPASGATKPFALNPWSEITSGFQRFLSERTLWLTVVGIAYFWFLGALVQLDLLLLGKEVMHLNDHRIGFLGAFLAVGIGVGSVLAGRLSGQKVELGLVPLGGLGMGLFSFFLSASSSSYAQTSFVLALLGLAGGFFIVPLNASLQQRAEREEKGRLLATSNFLSIGGVLLASVVLWLLREYLQISADRIILIAGFFTLLATGFALYLLPDFLVRFCLWFLTHTLYRIRIVGPENVPLHGPALLVCNHMSFVDGLLVGSCVQRFIRFLVYRPIYDRPALNRFMRFMKAIPVESGNRKIVLESLERAREQLRQGHVVCIFAEGAISRTGNLLPFKRGFEKIIGGLDNVPVIPVHLDRLWGSVFSFKHGRFFWKWPQRFPYPVTVSFGAPLPSTIKADKVRQTIAELGSAAVDHRRTKSDLLHLRFIATAKRQWFRFCMADSTGRELTYGKTLIGSLLLARWLRQQRPQDHMLGLLLPASVAGALANIATLIAGKVPVNLNFTAGREVMTAATQQCGITTILTSRTFLNKANLEALDGMVFIEDILKDVTTLARIWTAAVAFLTPTRLLQWRCNRERKTPHDLATVVFSSGSTGTPKGVMLSHNNVLSNVESIQQVFITTKEDCVMGVLPLFHSFGFTGTVWLPLIVGWRVVYHPNPLDAKTIGEMVQKYKATILISTPTFYASYLRRCTPEEFASLHFAIAGAEKLRPALAQAFKEKYGLDLLEGYGCTEMSPVISVNVPDVEHGSHRQIGFKTGTVGHPLPNVVVKVVDRETGATLPSGQEGLLLVKGPNRMMGYFGQPERTAEVLRDGWYVTGDIVTIDDDGFICITDRMSRFSKIGGEMVPHLRIEEAINQILGDTSCIVTAVPDEQKGERLVVLCTPTEVTADRLWEQLHQTDLPKLWIPKREHFYTVESLPLLGTGKVDLYTARITAVALAALERQQSR
jgi:acyl-[acyl-carrier-protein]-phospholipid O-acyltransferase/long-chain-fatty-acid--[acyl-carrier-protein] ligase